MGTKTMRTLLAGIAGALLCLAGAAFGAEASGGPGLRYAVILVGNRAGEQVVRPLSSGGWDVHFEFNDRGRGPKLDERIDCDRAGVPTKVEISGNDYFKGPVEERFGREGGTAAWRSAQENGSRPSAGEGFYLPFDGTPWDSGLLARALWKAPERKLHLLPEGEASIDRVGERTLRRGGEEKVVTQYAITGIDFQSIRVWLDAQGDFFASVSGWSSVIPEGWESAVAELQRDQDASSAAHGAELARSLGRRPSALVFEHASVFDSARATLRPATTVVVAGGRIAAVGPDGTVARPSGAEVIDASGKTLIPGLWDMHAHLSPGDGLLDIANGVTTVRDLGNDPDVLAGIKKGFDDGTVIGPRVVLAGLVDGSGPFSGPIKNKVDDEAQARAAVEDYARRGYVQIKIYSSIRPELMPVIARLAHARGMRVSGHVPAFMTAEQFVREGADEIQHANFLMLNFLFDDVKDTRTPARFTAVAEHGVEIDPSQDRVKAFLALLKEKGTVLDPTLVAFETMFVGKKGTISPADAAIADRMPPQVRRSFLSGSLPVPEGKEQRYRDSYRSMLRMIKAAYDLGIPIVAGTDDLAGFSLARELELYVEAGISAPEVLRIATLGGARVMKMDGDYGSIESGKAADLVLIDGDPTARIGDVRRADVVVKGGVVYRPAAIDRVIGVKPAS
jgi:imidazolonepropionase-like amidohydrolase